MITPVKYKLFYLPIFETSLTVKIYLNLVLLISHCQFRFASKDIRTDIFDIAVKFPDLHTGLYFTSS